MQISDSEFMNAAQQFNDEDFVRAIYKAYLKREPGSHELRFWTTEIKIKKGSRIAFPKQIRSSVEFTSLSEIKRKNSKKNNSPSQFILKYLFIGIKTIRKYFGIQSLKILAAINQVVEQTEFIMAASIDIPKTGDKINTSTYTIAGWLIWKNVRPTIRLITNKTVIHESSIQGRRLDVTNAYCLESETHDWGFHIFLNVKDLPDEGYLL